MSQVHPTERLLTPLCQLGFSVRVQNALERSDIASLYDLVRKSDEDLIRIKGFGKGCLLEIQTKLSALGLSLGMPISDAQSTRFNVTGAGDYFEEDRQFHQARGHDRWPQARRAPREACDPDRSD